jgi:hypothetical protein
MSRPTAGQLERSLASLTIGLVQGQQFRQRVLSDTYQGEWDQQVQLEFSGGAGNQWGFVDTDIMFEYPFLYAPTQRLVPFDRPHFNKGFELLTPSTTLVHLDAQVISWNINESNWTVGAKIRLYAVAPAADVTPELFRAIAHLTFQGYATYAEGDEFS